MCWARPSHAIWPAKPAAAERGLLHLCGTVCGAQGVMAVQQQFPLHAAQSPGRICVCSQCALACSLEAMSLHLLTPHLSSFMGFALREGWDNSTASSTPLRILGLLHYRPPSASLPSVPFSPRQESGRKPLETELVKHRAKDSQPTALVVLLSNFTGSLAQ